jgi:hypothetical protein
MTDGNSFVTKDADGRLFRVEVFGPGQNVKVTDIMSPTGVFWMEPPEKFGIVFLKQPARPAEGSNNDD